MSTDCSFGSTPLSNESSFEQQNTSEVKENQMAQKKISVIKKLSNGKYPVYLTSSKINNQKYVMKVFPKDRKKSNEHYNNELRFASLSHPNIISMIQAENSRTVIHNGQASEVSYILSEYAPHGDLSDFITTHYDEIDEKLARTYFRQLMDGIEYLHSLGIAHLDLKPENLLLDANFNLKIADFDLSYVASDEKVLSRGTKNYRGPEFYEPSLSPFELDLPSAADIYSAGIILFVLKSGGVYPHSENLSIKGVNLTELLEFNQKKFWKKHNEIQGKPKSIFDKSFKELFEKMVKPNPEQRISIKKIKESKWYNGPVYTPLELYLRMKTIVRY